jgi:hypothetical protein
MLQAVICEHNSIQLAEEHSFVRCLIEISKQYFDQQIMISLPHYDKQSFRIKVSGDNKNKFLVRETTNLGTILLQELMISGQWSVSVYCSAKETNAHADVKKIHFKPSSYFIYLQDNILDSLNDKLQCLKTFYFRYLKSRFVVILDKNFDDPEKAVTKVLSKLWVFKIINVVVLLKFRTQDVLQLDTVPKGLKEILDIGQFDSVIGIYTWFPYGDHSNCYNTRKIYLVDIWVMNGGGHFILNNYMFPNKIKNSLNNCPFVVSTTKSHPFVEDPTYIKTAGSVKPVYKKGWDISLLNIIAQVMNVSVHFIPPSWEKIGRLLPNGTFTGMIGDLIYSKCDIAVAGMPLVLPFAVTGDYTGIYSASEYIWLVPCARFLLGWRNIFRMFSSTLWLCILLSLLLAAGTIHCLAKCTVYARSEFTEGYDNLSESFCNTLAVFLGTAVSSVPRTTTLRIFFLAWIAYCLAVNTVIQSFLTSFLVKSDMEDQVSSFTEIVNSGMEYGFIPQFDVFFIVNDSPHFKNVLNDRKNCACERCCLRRLAYERNFAMLFNKVKYDYDIKYRYVDPETWKILVCRIPESFLSYYYTVYTPKGHQLLDRINLVISRIIQAGLFKEIQKLDVHMMRLKLEVRGEETHDDGFYQLTLKHLQVSFYILMAGHLISFFVLFLEIVFCKFKHGPNA